MKTSIFFLIIIIVLFSSCGLVTAPANQATDQQLDSAAAPVIVEIEPAPKQITDEDLVGDWAVKMKVTEVTCEGIKEGDVYPDKWIISKTNGKLKIVVVGKENIYDLFTGTLSNNNLILNGKVSEFLFKGEFSVKATMINENEFEGTREMIIDKPCKIEYIITGKRK